MLQSHLSQALAATYRSSLPCSSIVIVMSMVPVMLMSSNYPHRRHRHHHHRHFQQTFGHCTAATKYYYSYSAQTRLQSSCLHIITPGLGAERLIAIAGIRDICWHFVEERRPHLHAGAKAAACCDSEATQAARGCKLKQVAGLQTSTRSGLVLSTS